MAQDDIILPIETRDGLPIVRRLSFADLSHVLRKGVDDFLAMPTHVVFLCAIYPLAGLLIVRTLLETELVTLLYPLAAGFALLGPITAIGLYELSRRREMGLDTSWRHAFDVVHSPSLPAIAAVAALLLVIFAVWIAVADAIYIASFGHRPLVGPLEFLRQVTTTPEGWNLIVAGNLAGFGFALVAASASVISLPLLLDRNVGFAAALATSFRVVARNPIVMAAWFLIVALALLIGALPLFAGLAVVLPILGHATWHLYRRAVEPDPGPRPEFRPRPRRKRYAAEFPASLFAGSSDREKDR